VASFEDDALQPAKGLLAKLLDVQGVNQAMNREQGIRLLVPAIDPLADGQDVNAGELQEPTKRFDLNEVSRDTATIIHQQNIERAGLLEGSGLQLHECRAVRPHAGYRLIAIDLFGQDSPTLTGRSLGALPDLILD
jgi:hypothetical protein